MQSEPHSSIFNAYKQLRHLSLRLNFFFSSCSLSVDINEICVVGCLVQVRRVFLSPPSSLLFGLIFSFQLSSSFLSSVAGRYSKAKQKQMARSNQSCKHGEQDAKNHKHVKRNEEKANLSVSPPNAALAAIYVMPSTAKIKHDSETCSCMPR
jgi:hypothetical protein